MVKLDGWMIPTLWLLKTFRSWLNLHVCSKLLNSSYEVLLNTLTGPTLSSRSTNQNLCTLFTVSPLPHSKEHFLFQSTFKQYATIHPSLPYWIFQKLLLYLHIQVLLMGLSSILWLFWPMLSCSWKYKHCYNYYLQKFKFRWSGWMAE